MRKKGDIKNKTTAEFLALLQEKRAALQELRFAKASGKLKNAHKLRETRQDIARILTHLKQGTEK